MAHGPPPEDRGKHPEPRAREAESLGSSAERFARTFEMNPMAMSITRCSDGRVVETNEAMRQLVGFDPREAGAPAARSLGLWADPADRERLIAIVRAQGSVGGFEARMRKCSGEAFDARLWATILHLEGEDCLAVALANVSEQNRDRALILSIARGVAHGVGDALFRTLVRGVREAIGGDIVLVGEIEHDEIATVALLADGEMAPNIRYRRADTPCAASGEAAPGELVIVMDDLGLLYPDGGPLLEGMRAYVGITLRDNRGVAMGVLSVLMRAPLEPSASLEALFQIFAARAGAELTHRRDQRRIRELNESLEERVRRRTAELEEAVADLESFSYSVSHDLLAPLRSMNGYASIVLDEASAKLDGEQRAMLRRCIEEADRMGVLVNDLLTLARVGRRAIDFRPIDLSALGEEVAAEMLASQPGRPVQVTIQPGMAANGDRGLLRVVLDNLLRNAFKFTSGREHPRVELGALPGPAYYVRDNGVGFDPAHASSLFKPFHRLHTEAEFPGTGIGLAIVARVVARHGGEVRADGTPGEGATFLFTLGGPLVEPPAGDPVL